jgi:hypothetical protein
MGWKPVSLGLAEFRWTNVTPCILPVPVVLSLRRKMSKPVPRYARPAGFQSVRLRSSFPIM